MDTDDLLPVFKAGFANIDEPVEPSCPQEGRVHDVRAVGCAHNDDIFEFLEPVHLGKDLVEHIIGYVRIAARAPGRCERIDLVKEDDRWGDLAGLLEDFADGPLALAYPLGEELGPRTGMKLAPLSLATAFAIRVFPVPGGP